MKDPIQTITEEYREFAESAWNEFIQQHPALRNAESPIQNTVKANFALLALEFYTTRLLERWRAQKEEPTP